MAAVPSVRLALKLLFPPSLGKPKASARAELLEPALAQEIGDRVTVEVASDYAELERRALAGEVHLVWAPAAICARLEPTARAVFKVVRRKRSTYRSALIARAVDGLSLSKLRGRHAAWVDRLSLGGYVLIADYLRLHGVEPDVVFASQRFYGSHPAALAAVIHATADVAAVTVTGDDDAACRDALIMHAGPAAKSLVAIALSEPAPTDALVFTAKLAPAEAQRIIDKLFPQGEGRTRSFLCAAMECEGYARAAPNEYKQLLRLLKPGK